MGWAGEIGELTGAKAAELIAVNLLAPIQLARLLVPGMAKRGAGHVVFVSSIVGVTGARHEAGYAAAKAGMRHLRREPGLRAGRSARRRLGGGSGRGGYAVL